MTSFTDTDLLMDDFLFQETDTFALPLLDFDQDDLLLTSTELTMSHTHLQQTPFPATVSQLPTSPVSTDDDSTDAEVSTPPPVLLNQSLCSLEVDTTSSPAARVSLLGSSMTTHSPLPTGQKLLTHNVTSNSNSSSATSTPTDAVKVMQPIDKMQSMPAPQPFSDTLPYAMPVAFFPPSFNANQKRPLTHVLPSATSLSACGSASSSAATDDDPNAKKSKREIRQMKNRESANKSRLRRKAQLTTLTTKVTELKKKEQEMQTIIAGLRAENKSLLDQNTFLRSLVTSCKQEAASSRNDHQLATFTSPPPDQSCVTLNVLENGQKMDVDDETQTADLDVVMPRSGKQRTVASALSTASLTVCASVFGITVFADYNGGTVDPGNIRGVGRVLHEASTSCGMEGCSSETSMSLVGFVATAASSWWQLLSSSELVFGVLLNVLSFIAIVALYQLWQLHSAGGCAVLSKPGCGGARQQAE